MHSKIRRMLALSVFLLQTYITFCVDPLLYRRDLLIFLDWGGENIAQALDAHVLGAITNDLIEALYHESAPILCSATLWLNIVEHAQFSQDLLDGNMSHISKKYSKLASAYKVNDPLLHPSILKPLIEFRRLASQIYLQAHRDIKELENKNFNEKEKDFFICY